MANQKAKTGQMDIKTRPLYMLSIRDPSQNKGYIKTESESEVTQSCPTLSNPMESSLPGSSIHENFQARVLE